ncbi:MAG: 1-aminocyclopropane-1-carboxylate deaminase [candidate division TM6 bacterium GW2011_GWE2_41_16]|nr:MAG: 1-aminocyclopropane-1-carboxylate deaminase [candidate division TM6 bacterium GW2011_GWE2_41_16]
MMVQNEKRILAGLCVCAVFSLTAQNKSDSHRPIFDAYPDLKKRVPWVKIANLPTPVYELKNLERAEKTTAKIFIKDDGQAGDLVGSNKLRKLELHFGYAQNCGAENIIALGSVGSNYTTAIAAYAPLFGFKTIVLLKPQINTHYLRRNLLLSAYYGADIRMFKDIHARNEEVRHLQKSIKNYYIPEGGSNEIGTIGCVNAAFELQEQINAGLIKEPDYIYVPFVSLGTAAGLMLGLRAAGLKTKVVCVQAAPAGAGIWASEIAREFNQTAKFLHEMDEHFIPYKIAPSEVIIHTVFFGGSYAAIDQEEHDAIMRLYDLEQFKVDGTYAGKAFAALLHDLRKKKLEGKTILFWKTNTSGSFKKITDQVDYKTLPQALHVYFESDVQPLDAGC